MNAVCLYVSTAQLVLQTTDGVVSNTASNNTVITSASTAAPLNEQKLNDLNRLLPNLRQLLSCAVCCRLLNDPYAPRNGRCQHNVCRLCVRGRKSLRPFCSTCLDCQDFKTYDENRQLRCLLQCYKSLCEYLNNSSVFAQLSKQKVAPSQMVAGARPIVPLPGMSPQEFILEGCKYEDITNAFSADLPRPAFVSRFQIPNTTIATQAPLSTAAVTPLMPACTVQHLNTQTAPKVASPPKCITPNNATLPISRTPVSTAALTMTSNSTMQPPSLTIKYTKSAMDGATSLPTQIPSLSACTTTNSSTTMSLPITPTITYVGPNTPGIVVPIVSSSATTTAPLTIASAKLQSLNRHLAQTRNVINVPTTLTATRMASGNDSMHSSLAFKVSLAQPASTTSATVTSQQMRNPPPIKTVSNGSAMYSVLYTGIGNKITIKRKTDGDEESTQKKNAFTSVPPPIVFRSLTKPNPKRRGCRCGNATPTPGKLTCCGQRCPCYVDSKSCIGCKCRGCRNPHRPDGGKVRPVIPELACYDIQMADESCSLSQNDLPIATSKISQISPMSATAVETSVTQAQQQQSINSRVLDDYATKPSAMLPQVNVSTAPTKLISFGSLQRIATASSQQQLQTLTPVSASSHHTTMTSNVSGLENQPRDAVLIQNADGKYQVVNVFTTASLQRLHTITSQLQSNNSANNTANLPTASNTFILPNSNVTHTATAAGTMATGSINATSATTLPQIIIQPQNHHQTHTLQRLNLNNVTTTAAGVASSVSNSISALQLQQQLKQHNNNIITLHPISNQHAPTTQPQTIQLISSSTAAPTTTITFSPIIVTSPNNFTGDIYDSSDDYISLKNTSNGLTVGCNIGGNVTATSSHLVTMPALQTSASPSAMVEIVESNEL